MAEAGRTARWASTTSTDRPPSRPSNRRVNRVAPYGSPVRPPRHEEVRSAPAVRPAYAFASFVSQRPPFGHTRHGCAGFPSHPRTPPDPLPPGVVHRARGW
ncbi:predicted protein [Streptomyces viridosporus ATCC 14672]|uniref:Predicted protein n=1 Tax=Streptomyces viridosporus (strain ATCC 14672 / DSM 40746 / JCM 4963 / KCTC 9882 / NRRL B-12104 / FH 1290) TaxID=566461 RepID=D6A223_STRV1|nr:predicted protein [Streptomyces viridosporus ATCC 14672]